MVPALMHEWAQGGCEAMRELGLVIEHGVEPRDLKVLWARASYSSFHGLFMSPFVAPQC